MGKRLTDEELQFIKENMGKIPQADIARRINRSSSAISSVIRRNFKPVERKSVYKKLTEADEQFIAENMDMSWAKLAKLLSASEWTIRRRKAQIIESQKGYEFEKLHRVALGLCPGVQG